MPKQWFGWSVGTALLFSPTLAHAQSCYNLRVQRDQNSRVMLGIAGDYPKTHAALMACFANPDFNREESEKCGASILVVACFGLGFADCGDLTSRWQNAVATKERIGLAMRRAGCVE